MSEGVVEQGSTATITLLENATLTGTPGDNESAVYQISPASQLELGFAYTMDAAETSNTCLIHLLLSADGVIFYEYAAGVPGAVVSNRTLVDLPEFVFKIDGDAGVGRRRWYPVPTNAKYFKIQVEETGIAANGGVFTCQARVGDVKRIL